MRTFERKGRALVSGAAKGSQLGLMLSIAMVGGVASAQSPPRFRVVDLTDLGFTPNPDNNGTLGINNEGQVVYGRMNGSQIQAWIWLPEPDYGLSAGVHHLTGAPLPSIARDINSLGFIAGQAGATAPFAGVAAVWSISGGVASYSPLGTLGGLTPWSGAHAINDTNLVVGDSSKIDDCECPNPSDNDDQIVRGFKSQFDLPAPTMVELDPGGESFSFARDVNSIPSPRIAGYRFCLGGNCLALESCEPSKDAVSWDLPAPNVLADLGINGSETHGVNIAGNLVGWGFNSAAPCVRIGLYWTGPLSAPQQLLPPSNQNQASRVEAINNLSLPRQSAGTNRMTLPCSGRSRAAVIGW